MYCKTISFFSYWYYSCNREPFTFQTESFRKILTEKQQKISALLSGNIDKYEYLTGEEILSSYQRQIIEQAKFAYSPLGKAFEKQTEKQVGAIKSLDSPNKLKLNYFHKIWWMI